MSAMSIIGNPLRMLLRIFHPGNSMRAEPRPHQAAGGNHAPRPTHSRPTPRTGFRLAGLLITVLPAVVTFLSFHWLFAWIQASAHYQFNRWIPALFWNVGQRSSPRSEFYRDLLAKALTASDISLVQAFMMAGLLYVGTKLLLLRLGDYGVGKRARPYASAASYTSLCIYLLPAFGFLSTIIGILSAGSDIPRETIKLIIFGPSGIGMVGYIIASGLNHFAMLGEDQ